MLKEESCRKKSTQGKNGLSCAGAVRKHWTRVPAKSASNGLGSRIVQQLQGRMHQHWICNRQRYGMESNFYLVLVKKVFWTKTFSFQSSLHGNNPNQQKRDSSGAVWTCDILKYKVVIMIIVVTIFIYFYNLIIITNQIFIILWTHLDNIQL